MSVLSELKRQQQQKVEKAICYRDIDWNNFLFTFKEPHVRVLEVVYLPEPKSVIYKHIYEAFKKINYSERSARRIINYLAELGLLINFRSTFGVVKPVPEVTQNVHSLIQLYRSKENQVNRVKQTSYDEIAKLIMEDKEWQSQEEDQKQN